MNIIESSDKYKYIVSTRDSGKMKVLDSENYHYRFRISDGRMLSWGKTMDDDPGRCPVPNILDMEISTKCWKAGNKEAGLPSAGVHCPFCYKSNNSNGKVMSFETFKHIFDVQSKGLTQIAFGSGFYGIENPDIYKMMDYCRDNNVVPNITVGAVTDETADEFAKRVGAIAISLYEDTKEVAYDSVKRMTDRGINQTNIHFMICEETYDRCLEVLNDIKTDDRLKNLNAIVMLSLKTKGRGASGEFHPLSQEKFNNLCKIALDNNIGLGFDSCSSLKAARALGGKFRDSIIPCESAGIESSYISVDGKYYPCSFAEGVKTNEIDWTEGVDVLSCNSTEEFLDRVWNNEKTLSTQKIIYSTCECNECGIRTCPFYNV